MFESQYNDEMAVEVIRLEAKKRATDAGHPEWINACVSCGSILLTIEKVKCSKCV